MEKVILHLMLHVILFTTFSSVRNVRPHFYKMCLSVSSPINKARDFALWSWSAHNMVSERLMKEEASLGTGDPKFPKMIWRPKKLCPTCHQDLNRRANRIEWNKDEVYKFLTRYYGEKLSYLYKNTRAQPEMMEPREP